MIDFTPLLRLYATRRLKYLDAIDPIATQYQQLIRLLRKARTTLFGKQHNFNSIQTITQFQKHVPLRTYETFWNQYWKPPFPLLHNVTWPGLIPFFVLSAGTSSGTTKYIPCTHAINYANTRAALDLLCFHVKHKPTSQILGGKSLMLGETRLSSSKKTLSSSVT